MSHIKGSAYENKTISQHISELIKKNTNIFKQIDQYVQNNKHINIPESSSLAKQNQIQDISLRLFKINWLNRIWYKNINNIDQLGCPYTNLYWILGFSFSSCFFFF